MKTRPKPRGRETRFITVEDLELRAADGDRPPEIDGHAIRYNVWSEDLGGFRERIMPGAARKTITESDIRALFNHDPNYVLGRNKAGTLDLSEDNLGLRNIIRPPDTQTIRDLVIEPMRRKDITQQSFAFRAISDVWREPDQAQSKDGLWERDVSELRLYDVSIVTFPAFTQASAHVRTSLGELEGIGIDWPALTALLTRADRGIPLSDSDTDLLNGSVAVLRSFLPEPEPLATTPLPPTGRSIAHLSRLLDLRERELLTV